MALRGLKSKDIIKKSSYYVWFLGAKESRGLRGDEYIRPAVQNLVDRECEVEPLKVTLQVSSKGLKIIQNINGCGSGNGSGGSGGSSSSSSKNKADMVKHFIPDHSITCVTQEPEPNDDIVACILLIYNPVSKCPVHVHAYRCDSVETATVLRQQLQALVEHPENQRKFSELEVRLQAKGLLPPKKVIATSDGRSVRTESDSSGGGSTSDKEIYVLDEKMNNLYDSLAAELREKLNNNKNHGPILLPPRDYDTVHRMKGKLDGIDDRRCLQKGIVGTNVKGRLKSKEAVTTAKSPDSSGKSSGIGSDEAPSSPTHERGVGKDRGEPNIEHRYSNPMNNSPRSKKNAEEEESSSDEEWRANNDPQAIEERDMILVQSPQRFRRATALVGGAKAKIREHPIRSLSPSNPSMPLPPPSIPPLSRERHHDRMEDIDHRVPHYTESGGSAVRHNAVPHHGYVTKSGNAFIDKQRKYSDNDRRISPRHLEEYDINNRNDDSDYDNRIHDKPLLQRSRSREDHIPISRSTDRRNEQMLHAERSKPLPYNQQQQPPKNANHRHSYDRLGLNADEQRGVSRYHDVHSAVPNRERHLASSSSTPYSATSKLPVAEYGGDVPYHDGYHAPLPRVRRLDSGHSSSMSNNNNNNGVGSSGTRYHSPHRKPQSSINKGPNYQELPDEKRYPGLDRDTARIQHHYLPTVSTTPHQMESKKSGRRNEPTESRKASQHADHRERYNLSPSPPPPPPVYNGNHGHRRSDNVTGDLVAPHCPTTTNRVSNRLVPRNETQGQPQRQPYCTNDDEKRFYRYSSSDADLIRPGHRMQQGNGYRF